MPALSTLSAAAVEDDSSLSAAPDMLSDDLSAPMLSASTGTAQTSSSTRATGLLSGPGLWEPPPGGGKKKIDKTPAVLFSRTDANTLGASGCSNAGGKPDIIYEVSLTFQELLAWGGVGPIPGLKSTGETTSGDYLMADGQATNGSGALSFRWAANASSSRKITFRIANNGLLNLQRLAASSHDVVMPYGGNASNGWTMASDRALDILVAMQIGVDPKQISGRDGGSLSGIQPNAIAIRLNRAITATVAASMAERCGEQVVKSKIDASDRTGKTYRDRAPWAADQNLSWVDETKFKLNREMTNLFVDQPGVKPFTYVSGNIDFSAAIEKMFKANGYLQQSNPSAEAEFLADVKALLKQNLNLDWLENTDPSFKKKFEADWGSKMDEVFKAVTLSKIIEVQGRLATEKTYSQAIGQVSAPSSTIHRNGSGRTDGNAQLGMPDFSTWGLQESKTVPPEPLSKVEATEPLSTAPASTDAVATDVSSPAATAVAAEPVEAEVPVIVSDSAPPETEAITTSDPVTQTETLDSTPIPGPKIETSRKQRRKKRKKHNKTKTYKVHERF